MIRSLRFRILAVVAVGLLVATLVGGLLARHNATSLAQDLQDQDLRAMAFGFFSSVTASQGGWVTPEELAEFIPADVDQYFYRLIGPKGAYISGYNFVQVPVPESSAPGVTYFATWTDGSGDTFRGVSIRAFVDSFESPGWVTLQVAQSTRGANALVANQMRTYFWTTGLISLGTLLSATFILATIFRPVRRLTKSVERRSAEDLSPIQQEVPIEVQPLKDRLNSLFRTVRDEQQAQNRLIGNVAHQLRTPLTTIRLRSSLAREAQDPLPHIDVLDREAKRAGEMAARLVALENRAKPAGDTPLDLEALVHKLVDEWREQFSDQNMLLFWEKKAKPVAVNADADMVNEILSNLVDNALKHSAATQVRIVLDGASVRVQDNGMGVPDEQLPQIFERFHRGDNAKASGYGLGLSIVKEYANRIGAEVDASCRPGLSVLLRFRAFHA